VKAADRFCQVCEESMTTKANAPKIIQLEANEVDDLQQRIAARKLTEQDYDIFAAIVAAYHFVVNLLTQKKLTIARLKKLVSASSASRFTPPADSGPFPLPSPLARSPVEAKCSSLPASLPRTVPFQSLATIARPRQLFLRPHLTRDAHVRLLGDSAESLPRR
jgi:hypothetical protein